MTDNFNAYKQFITEKWSYSDLPEGDSYFVVELIRRGKDNPDMPAANYHFKNYYIRKPEDLDKYEQEIKSLCEILHLRAYASVNIKSFKQVSLDTMAELARRIANNDYRKNYAVFESCSGQYCHSEDKQWVVDLDDCKIGDEYVYVIEDYIRNCEPVGVDKIITRIPTRSGVHLITTPFNRKQFADRCKYLRYGDAPDIKKNHLTLLYENLQLSMDRQEQYKRAIKTFTYLDHSLDEKSLLLGMNWADEFPEFKFEEFIEKTVNWMKSIVTKEGNSEERVITDKMIEEYLKVVKDTY